DALTTTPAGVGGGRPALPRANTYMSLSIPGNPIDETQFANAWSPTNPQGSVWPTENFSTLVDSVPVLSPAYFASGASIDNLYGEIVRANVAPPPPDPEGQAAYERAFNLLYADVSDFDEQGRPVTVKGPSPFYINYRNKYKRYTDVLVSYLTNYLQYDLSNPNDARRWAILAPTLRGPVDEAYNDLQTARPGVIENAVATLGQYQQSSLAAIFTRARQTYETTRKGSLADPNIFWHLCEPFPANWFAPSAADNFTQVTIDSQRVRITENSRFESYGASGGVNFGLWRVGGGGSHQSQQYDLSEDTTGLKASFRFGRVEIRRRWLDASLLSLRGWSTAGRSPGSYSNGNDSNNPGVFSLLPTSFIVARDIQISATWGSTDIHNASQSTSASASVGWGPFSLSGSYSNSSSTRTFNSSFDGTTIIVPGIQIVAWLSTIVPFCPPTGGPPAQPPATRFAVPQRRNPYALPYTTRASLSEQEQGEFISARTDNGGSRRTPIPSQPVQAPIPDIPMKKTVSAEDRVASNKLAPELIPSQDGLMLEVVSLDN
ncbi:hypothetical protein, partial [Nostoc linckia]